MFSVAELETTEMRVRFQISGLALAPSNDLLREVEGRSRTRSRCVLDVYFLYLPPSLEISLRAVEAVDACSAKFSLEIQSSLISKAFTEGRALDTVRFRPQAPSSKVAFNKSSARPVAGFSSACESTAIDLGTFESCSP